MMNISDSFPLVTTVSFLNERKYDSNISRLPMTPYETSWITDDLQKPSAVTPDHLVHETVNDLATQILATAAEVAAIVAHTETEDILFSEAVNSTFLLRYLEGRLGPQRIDSSTLIPITIVYTLIFITGIIGNFSTCFVIIRSPHLQTATNYYLFSLAVADIVTLILGLPNDLWVYWRQYPYIFGSIICSLRALVSEMTSNASVLTIVAFTVERYLAICHPLYKQKMSNLPRVVKIITILWFIAFTSAVPFAVFTTVNYIDFPPGSGHMLQESSFCAMSIENNHHNMPLLLFSSFVFFVIPVFFIVILYVKIGMTLKKATLSRLASESYPGNGRQQYSRKVLKILVSVVVAFFLCWAPFHAQRLLFVYVDAEGWTDARLRDLNEKLYYVAGCFYYFNCTINPILYNVISDKYRRAFRDTLCCCCFTHSRRNGLRYPLHHHFVYSSSYAFSMRRVRFPSSPLSKVKVNCEKTYPSLFKEPLRSKIVWIASDKLTTKCEKNGRDRQIVADVRKECDR